MTKGDEGRRSDTLRLADMLAAASGLETIRALGAERFLSDPIVRDAAIRRLEVLGEAAGAVSTGTRNRYPDVPWRRMRGLSSFAKHEYWRVDPAELWNVIEAVPAIRRELSRVEADSR
jgi:uncharacterized protein with HEPN domain